MVLFFVVCVRARRGLICMESNMLRRGRYYFSFVCCSLLLFVSNNNNKMNCGAGVCLLCAVMRAAPPTFSIQYCGYLFEDVRMCLLLSFVVVTFDIFR